MEEKVNDEDGGHNNRNSNFREKFRAEYRTADGHQVRSRAEVMIDDWLYRNEIIHAYERKLPIRENLYSDFYLPKGNVYIEYWGYNSDNQTYEYRKRKKIAIYRKYSLNLIEMNDDDIRNLDDILPNKLLKFGIQVL